jgi:hypothetical protein
MVRLWPEASRAEFRSRTGEARALYLQTCQEAKDDDEACVAAHCIAHHQEHMEEALRWNQAARIQADAVGDDWLCGFFPKPMLNMGQSHEWLGNRSEAR